MKIQIVRTRFGSVSTHGVMFVNGDFFGYTIEDVVRIPFEKVQHETAIQAGDYEAEYSYSAKFRRDTIRLKHVEGFDGILIHEGNDSKDSSGCILVGGGIALNGITNSRIWVEKLEKQAHEARVKKEPITVHICNSLFDIMEMSDHCPISLVELSNRCW